MPAGIGITSMRDRIEAVGGQIEIVSIPGKGTSIIATIPDGEAQLPCRGLRGG